MNTNNQLTTTTAGLTAETALLVKNFQTILKTHLKHFTIELLETVTALLTKQPKEIQNQWLTLAKAGKFEPEAAALACKNWAGIITPFYRPKSIIETFDGLSPSLATLKKYQSEMVTALILCKIIKDTANFYNVGGAINDYQIQQTAVLIIDTFYFLNIKDFVLCFNMAKAGKFGKLFDRLDGAIFLNWLEQYNELRLQAAQEKAQNEAQEKKIISIDSAICQVLKKYAKSKPEKVAPKMSAKDCEEKRRADVESIKLIYKPK
jgi:hypothetical protein